MKQILPVIVSTVLISGAWISPGKNEQTNASLSFNEKIFKMQDSSKITLEVVEKFNAAFNRHDVDGVMKAMTEDCVFENTSPSPDGNRVEGAAAVRAYWQKFFTSNPDAYFEAEDMFAAGNRCVVRWIYHKT